MLGPTKVASPVEYVHVKAGLDLAQLPRQPTLQFVQAVIRGILDVKLVAGTSQALHRHVVLRVHRPDEGGSLHTQQKGPAAEYSIKHSAGTADLDSRFLSGMYYQFKL